MGLFESIFGKRPKTGGNFGTYKLLNGYSPTFTRFGDSIYESEIIRAAINARATHISKLNVEFRGGARKTLQSKLKKGPNQFQTWSQFLYRLSTILDVNNTAFICPVLDEYGDVTGVYTPLPEKCEIVQYNNIPYLRYEFSWGDRAAIEMKLCGIMTKYQYQRDLFGDDNKALYPTLDLINTQNQGIEEGVKSAASYKFMARVNNFSKTDDLANERKRFTTANFAKDAEARGLLLFPNTYTDIKQIDTKPWMIDAAQRQAIKDNVYQYFGVNEKILTNEFDSEIWSAFYEGAVEPWAVQFSEVMTKMLYTLREQAAGSFVMATANRLQYMSNADKLQVSAQMADRGIMSINEIRQIWNLPPVDGGDVRTIRGEYYAAGDEVKDEQQS